MGYETIICGVTGSAASEKAAYEAARLAKENRARLIYVYVVDITFLKGITIQLRAQFAEESLEHVGKLILDHVEGFALSQGLTPKKILRKGVVLEVLKRVVLEEKAELLVLGDEKRSFFQKVLFGGKVKDYVQELENHTGISVVVVK
jgi:nucleotide-binding universal stress UspA family protein